VQNVLSLSSLSKNIKIKVYRTIILAVFLDGCENWFLKLWENHRLTVFKNTVLRKIFWLKKGYVRKYRRLHKEELCDPCYSPNIIWVMKSIRRRRTRHIARMVDRRGPYRVFVGKSEEKRPLGRPRLGWENNIKMYFQEV
jgi:hypothetical protein